MATKKATIKRKISAIAFSKEEMRKAINSKGRDIKKDAAFSTYGEEIRQIISGDTIEDLGSITITKNGSPTIDKNSGYSNAEVNVTGNVVPYEETVTKNGTISASGDIDGYSSITVQVVGKDGKPIGEKKKAHGLGTKTITKNGVYKAEDDGFKGYSQVNVKVIKSDDKEDHGQKYKVTFKNKDGTVLQTVENVPFGGAAAYTGEEPNLESMDKIGYWYGWNPIPFDIRQDTVCEAVYGDFNCGYKDPNEIKDNWDKICSTRGGEKYKVGQWRLLCFAETEYDYTSDQMVGNDENGDDHFPMFMSDAIHQYYMNEDPKHLIRRYGMVRMMKVADGGEDGSTSTWITIDRPAFNVRHRGENNWGTSLFEPSQWGKRGYNMNYWETMLVRDFLNNYFLQALPKCLQTTILEVEKYSSGYVYADDDTEHTGPLQFKANNITQDKIWVPSRREMFGNYKCTNEFDWVYYIGEQKKFIHIPEQFETEGPTYGSRFNSKLLESMCTTFGTNNSGPVRLRSIAKNKEDFGNIKDKEYLGGGNAYIGNAYTYYTTSNPYSSNQFSPNREGTRPFDSGPLAHWPFGFCL